MNRENTNQEETAVAVSRSAVTIYRVSAKNPSAGVDRPIATIDAATPVAALEEWARRCGFTSYSLDTSRLAYWLCPEQAQFFYYAYTEVAS